MAMNKVPTLIIGLGGIGCRIAAGVNQLLSSEDKQYVGAVGIDTNVNDLAAVAEKGLQTIRISDNRLVHDYLVQNPELRRWFPVHSLLTQKGMSAGAGQIRAISRLAALAAEKRGDFRPIETEIMRITKTKPHGSKQNLAVVITGSITGGTGAGMFLQLPFYIRNLVKNTKGLQSLIIRGMFVGADITRPSQTTDTNRKAVGVNAYSCIKELNMMYMTQMFPEMAEKIELDFYDDRNKEEHEIDWEPEDEAGAADKEILSHRAPMIPYDYLYLLEGSSRHGGLDPQNLPMVEKIVSRTLFTLLFTPLVNNAMSIEDNFILAHIDRSGMNRYASSGLCRLVFPSDLVREYVVMSNVKELVDKQWRLIDRKCEETVRVAQAKRRADGRTEIPTMARNYCDHFEAAVGITESGEGAKKSPLAVLLSEVCLDDDTSITIVDRFMTELDGILKKVYESDAVTAAAKSCKLDESAMASLDMAGSAIATLEAQLEKYEKLTEKTVTSNYARIANELIPTSVESMVFSEEAGTGIFKWIATLHPVAARYFCYALCLKLEQRIAAAKKAIGNIDRDEYEKSDFDDRTPDTQSASSALQVIRDKRNIFYKWLVSDASKTRKLTSKIRILADEQVNNLTTWMKESLYQNVCQMMLERLEKLAENYKLFFDTIACVIELNDDRLHDLEVLQFPFGEVGVYCTAEALRKMASEYRVKNEMTLPDETKKAIFREMFRITANDLMASVDEPEHEKEKRMAQNKADLRNAFNTAVIRTLNAEVKKNGASIVNMTIKQALAKEFELTTGIREATCDPADFHAKVTAYILERIKDAMDMAEPLLAVDSGALDDRAELVFFAVNPECAERIAGKPDVGATKDAYFSYLADSTGNSPVHVLMDDEFSPYEMTCVRTQYLFEVDDLIKYAPESQNAREYLERINNLGGVVTDVTSADAFKTVINPHLNRHWHQEGYIPALTTAERKISDKEKYMAFAYAVGMDLAVLMEDDDDYIEGTARKIWCDFTTRSQPPIQICGNRISGTYYALLESLDFNRSMKKRFLRHARRAAELVKGYTTGEELMESLMDTDFIADLIQPAGREDSGDLNVYNVFLSMRDFVPAEVFTKLFTGLLNAIWAYNSCLLDKSAKLVNKATKRVLAAIYENSSVGKKEAAGEELSFGEKQLKKEHENLMSQTFYC